MIISIFLCSTRQILDKHVYLEFAGIIDTDGYYDAKGHSYEIVQKSKILSDDILFLARSLGFVAYQREVQKFCTYKGEKKYGWYYNVHISGSMMHEIPCRLEKKKNYPSY